MSTVKSPIKSPCINVCTVDGITKHCLGCYRTLREIATWHKIDDDERDAIMAQKDEREVVVKAKRAEWAKNNFDPYKVS